MTENFSAHFQPENRAEVLDHSLHGNVHLDAPAQQSLD